MLRKKQLLLILFSCFSTYLVYGQLTVEKLKSNIKNAKTDSVKIDVFLQTGTSYANNNPDSALVYFEKAVRLSKKINYTWYEAKAYQNIGNCYLNKSNYDNAYDNYMLSIKKYEIFSTESGKKNADIVNTGISDCYNNVGLLYLNKGRNEQALDFFQKSLIIKEKILDSIGMSNSYANIGIVQLENKSYDNAIDCFQKSITISQIIHDKKGYTTCYVYIGVAYLDQKKYELAIEHFNAALTYLDENNNKKDLSACYNNIGAAYIGLGNKNEAMHYFIKSLKIKEQLGDNYGLAVSLGGLSNLLISLADSSHDKNEKTEKYLIAIDFAEKGLAVTRKIEAASLECKYYKSLSNAWLGMNDYKNAYSNLILYVNLTEKISNRSKSTDEFKNAKTKNSTQKINLDKLE